MWETKIFQAFLSPFYHLPSLSHEGGKEEESENDVDAAVVFNSEAARRSNGTEGFSPSTTSLYFTQSGQFVLLKMYLITPLGGLKVSRTWLN